MIIKQTVYGEDPDLSPEELIRLSEHHVFMVRQAVAMNPSTPIETIIKLIQDQDKDVANAAKAVIINLKDEVLTLREELKSLQSH